MNIMVSKKPNPTKPTKKNQNNNNKKHLEEIFHNEKGFYAVFTKLWKNPGIIFLILDFPMDIWKY